MFCVSEKNTSSYNGLISEVRTASLWNSIMKRSDKVPETVVDRGVILTWSSRSIKDPFIFFFNKYLTCICFSAGLYARLWEDSRAKIDNTLSPWNCILGQLDSWVGKIPWRRTWQPTPEFLPGESPWMEEPGRLQSVGLHRVRHN